MKKYVVNSSWKVCGAVNSGCSSYSTIDELIAGYKKSINDKNNIQVDITLSNEFINSLKYTERRMIEELEYVNLYKSLEDKGIHVESLSSKIKFYKQYGLPTTKKELD